jgi:aminobenzoyl-glutamate transport protein
MTEPSPPPRGVLQRLLDAVERAGNKVPHPAILFLLLIALVVVLSHVLHLLGVGVTYQRVNPPPHAVETATTGVNSLLSADGVRFVCTSVVPNFVNFGPVGIILVAMIGVGLAERSG